MATATRFKFNSIKCLEPLEAFSHPALKRRVIKLTRIFLMQEIWLRGKGVGKARPRFYKGTVYTANKYGAWKRGAIAQIISLKLPPAPKPCFIECYFVNFFSSDADNLQGSVMDAMVQAGFLENDSSSYVVGCSGIFVKQPKQRKQEKAIGILIRVAPANIGILSLPKAA